MSKGTAKNAIKTQRMWVNKTKEALVMVSFIEVGEAEKRRWFCMVLCVVVKGCQWSM